MSKRSEDYLQQAQDEERERERERQRQDKRGPHEYYIIDAQYNTIKKAKALKFTATSTTPLLQLTPLSLLPLLPRSWDTLLTVSSSEEDWHKYAHRQTSQNEESLYFYTANSNWQNSKSWS